MSPGKPQIFHSFCVIPLRCVCEIRSKGEPLFKNLNPPRNIPENNVMNSENTDAFDDRKHAQMNEV